MWYFSGERGGYEELDSSVHSQTRFKAGDAHVYEDVAGKSHDTPLHMSGSVLGEQNDLKISHHHINYGEWKWFVLCNSGIISLLHFSLTLDFKFINKLGFLTEISFCTVEV